MPAGYDSDALAALDDFLGDALAGLAPAKRKRTAMKLGRALRRSKLGRIKANEEPDGSPMEERKPRLDRRGNIRRKAGGKMFRKLRYARLWAIKATPDSVEVMPKGRSPIPETHHFGKKGLVGRAPDGRKVFAKYPRRRLLGFVKDDEDLALDIVAELIDR